MDNDPLTHVREICLPLPEAEETPAPEGSSMSAYKVAGKTFAYYCDNHHGDGRLAVWCKAAPGVQEAFVGAHPDRYFVPPYVGPRGWIGARVDVPGVDWDEVAYLVEESYGLSAPKRLRASRAAPAPGAADGGRT